MHFPYIAFYHQLYYQLQSIVHRRLCHRVCFDYHSFPPSILTCSIQIHLRNLDVLLTQLASLIQQTQVKPRGFGARLHQHFLPHLDVLLKSMSSLQIHIRYVHDIRIGGRHGYHVLHEFTVKLIQLLLTKLVMTTSFSEEYKNHGNFPFQIFCSKISIK